MPFVEPTLSLGRCQSGGGKGFDPFDLQARSLRRLARDGMTGDDDALTLQTLHLCAVSADQLPVALFGLQYRYGVRQAAFQHQYAPYLFHRLLLGGDGRRRCPARPDERE